MEENKRLLEANNLSTSGTTCQPSTKTEVTSTTPDYAAGLAPLNPPTPAPSTPQHIPSYVAPATPLSVEQPVKEEPASMYTKNTIVFTVCKIMFYYFVFDTLCINSLKILNSSLIKKNI